MIKFFIILNIIVLIICCIKLYTYCYVEPKEAKRKQREIEELKRLEAEEQERLRLEAEKSERQRLAEEQERLRLEAEERERQRLAEEQERLRLEAEEYRRQFEEVQRKSLIVCLIRGIGNKKEIEEFQRKSLLASLVIGVGLNKERQEQLRIEAEERARREVEVQERLRLEEEEREQKRRAKIDKKIKEYQRLEQKFLDIGAKMVWKKKDIEAGNYIYDVDAKEDVIVSELFKLMADDYSNGCGIVDDNGNYIIAVEGSEKDGYIVIFPQDDYEKVFDKGNIYKQVVSYISVYLNNRRVKRLEEGFASIIKNGVEHVSSLVISGNTIEEHVVSALYSSVYDILYKKNVVCAVDEDMLLVDYELPNILDIPNDKEYKYVASTNDISIKKFSDSYMAKLYENILYSITLRSLYEVFSVDNKHVINNVVFNGCVTSVNVSTGITERKCIISIQVDRNKFSQLNLAYVEPKACFKALKGVSAAKLIDVQPITPIITFNKEDKRFIEGKNISVNQGTNLAAMHWEDFEQLVRELFEMEFAKNGSEVKVTQASRDGGVDAIIFDPDPLRGGKIVVQAKRYTNTVGVSAVRDLYGTVINEGANTGILITTSDYGSDSYAFAKDKPIKLLNGGHLLALLQKNGKKAHINIEAAKKLNEVNK